MKAHFIVNTVEGVMLTICGAAIPPRDVQGARVGIYAQICKDCETAVKGAWVTVK